MDLAAKQGRAIFGVDLKIVDDAGSDVASDTGEGTDDVEDFGDIEDPVGPAYELKTKQALTVADSPLDDGMMSCAVYQQTECVDGKQRTCATWSAARSCSLGPSRTPSGGPTGAGLRSASAAGTPRSRSGS